ncbi:hypothetical protein DFH09DRAFT_1080629 [Mycena vulgaris]|nr:hypothetical protein DFH09DRAFT_1080629 [Mycena vulgaris]
MPRRSRPPTAEAAFEALDLNLTEEEDEKKKSSVGLIDNGPGRWESMRTPTSNIWQICAATTSLSRNEWAEHQFYMQHPEFRAKVNEAFEDEHRDAAWKERLALRCAVATKLLAAEPEDVKEHLKVENRAAHNKAMANYEEEEEGEPSVDTEVQQRCRKKFLAEVSLLLTGLRAYTGYVINVVGERVDGEDFDVVSANTGFVDWCEGSICSVYALAHQHSCDGLDMTQSPDLDYKNPHLDIPPGISLTVPLPSGNPPRTTPTAPPATSSLGISHKLQCYKHPHKLNPTGFCTHMSPRHDTTNIPRDYAIAHAPQTPPDVLNTTYSSDFTRYRLYPWESSGIRSQRGLYPRTSPTK